MGQTFDLQYIRQWRTIKSMVIKETHYFTEIIQKLMSDESYAELQKTIIQQPDIGKVIPGSGGLRKVRWKKSGAGKRGGTRIIYYWINEENEIYMLYAYAKCKNENLTQNQIKLLRKYVEEELNNG